MNDVAQLGDIWRIHYWKDPDNHDAGIKAYTYIFIEVCNEIAHDDPYIGKEGSYHAIEIETGIDNSIIYSGDLNARTRTFSYHDYIVFAEKLA